MASRAVVAIHVLVLALPGWLSAKAQERQGGRPVDLSGAWVAYSEEGEEGTPVDARIWQDGFRIRLELRFPASEHSPQSTEEFSGMLEGDGLSLERPVREDDWDWKTESEECKNRIRQYARRHELKRVLVVRVSTRGDEMTGLYQFPPRLECAEGGNVVVAAALPPSSVVFRRTARIVSARLVDVRTGAAADVATVGERYLVEVVYDPPPVASVLEVRLSTGVDAVSVRVHRTEGNVYRSRLEDAVTVQARP